MLDQMVPGRQATRVPGSVEQPIGVGDDLGSVGEQVAGDETVPLPAGGQQATSAGQVGGLHLCVAVAGSVRHVLDRAVRAVAGVTSTSIRPLSVITRSTKASIGAS